MQSSAPQTGETEGSREDYAGGEGHGSGSGVVGAHPPGS